MKTSLLLFFTVCGFTYGTAIAQNADLDFKQQLNNNPPGAVFIERIPPVSETVSDQKADRVLSPCTADTMCAQLTTFSGNVRGYYFIAPVAFSICGLFIPTDASTDPQSIEVLRFDSIPPPAYPAITNKFVSLFYVANDTSTSMIPCSIPVQAGDTIGVYGARGTGSVCSYGTPQFNGSIFGNPVILNRTGMQFPLYNQQMHDVWSEDANDISRVIMYIDASLSVNEIPFNDLVSVFPNPFSSSVTLQAENLLKNATLTVYNSVGQQVKQIINISGQEIKLQRGDLPAGLYFIRLVQGNKVIAADKLVITEE